MLFLEQIPCLLIKCFKNVIFCLFGEESQRVLSPVPSRTPPPSDNVRIITLWGHVVQRERTAWEAAGGYEVVSELSILRLSGLV